MTTKPIDYNSICLRNASLAHLHQSMVDTLDFAQATRTEVQRVIDALHAGKVDGGMMFGPCRCLFGWIAEASEEGWTPRTTTALRTRFPDTTHDFTPIERFVTSIRAGDTPADSEYAATLLHWLEGYKLERPA